MSQNLVDHSAQDAAPERILKDAMVDIASAEAIAKIVDIVLAEVTVAGGASACFNDATLRAEIVAHTIERFRGAEVDNERATARTLATVDFGTVLSALTAGGRLAALDALHHGLKPAGRP